MHKLNFCGALCLPKQVEGHKARGIDFVKSFDEAYVLPMGGIATPLHVLYISKPVTHEGRIVDYDDLKDTDSVERLIDSVLAPDFAVDPDPRCDLVHVPRDDNLRFIVDRILDQGYDSVVLWSNNGIGPDASGDDDGIMREDGIASAIRLHGEVHDQYQKGLPSYQNSAHDHIHIAPDTGFGDKLFDALREAHDDYLICDFDAYRKRARDGGRFLPCMSVSIVERKSHRKLNHYFFAGADARWPEGTNTAGFMRKIVLQHSLDSGLDLGDKAVKSEELAKTKDFYTRVLA